MQFRKKMNSMPVKFKRNNRNPLVQLVRNLLSRFLPASDTYPVRYYKKGKYTKFK
ncbi:MAG: hypothetical protein ABIQ31_00205 [Ferruginibacter sp.]